MKHKSPTNKILRSVIVSILLIVAIVLAIFFSIKHKKTKQVDMAVKEAKTTAILDSKSTNTKETTTTEVTTTKKQTLSKSSETKFTEPKIIEIDPENWYLTCVNRDYGILKSYVPTLTKINISENDPRYSQANANRKLDYRVTPHYQKMYDAAAKEGIYLTPYSAYRSMERQELNFNYYTTMYKNQGYSTDEAKFKASNRVLPAGTSEHNLGFAVDIVCADSSFNNTKEAKWLKEHAHEYGFILRYPADKTKITNVMHESWHYRYVGKEVATKMKQNNLCLEEYLGIK